MLRRLAVLVSLVVSVCGLSVAPTPSASAAGAFTVSISSSKTRADVGRTTVLSGKVTGKGAARKRLVVESRVSGGPWKRVTTTRTTKRSTYRVAVRVPRAGDLAFRVVAPRRGRVGRGTSKAVALTGYRWLDLYDESYLSGGGTISRGHDTTIGGTRPSQHTFGMGGGSYLYWNLDRRCDRVVAQVGVSDSDDGVTREVVLETTESTPEYPTGGAGLVGYADLQAADASSFRVTRLDTGYAYLVTPRAHCATEALPVALD